MTVLTAKCILLFRYSFSYNSFLVLHHWLHKFSFSSFRFYNHLCFFAFCLSVVSFICFCLHYLFLFYVHCPLSARLYSLHFVTSADYCSLPSRLSVGSVPVRVKRLVHSEVAEVRRHCRLSRPRRRNQLSSSYSSSFSPSYSSCSNYNNNVVSSLLATSTPTTRFDRPSFFFGLPL